MPGERMRDEGSLAELERRLERLRAELGEESPVMDRAPLRDEILALHREITGSLERLEALREALKAVVERYRALHPRDALPSDRPVPVRLDHIGSATYRERGWSAFSGADDERAVREFRRALELDPEEPANAALLAWAYARLDHRERAAPLVEMALERAPTHPVGRTVLGFLQMKAGEYEEAVESLSAVIRDGSDRTAILFANLYLGMVYSQREMHREAQAIFRRAIELGPNHAEAYWELGLSFAQEGRRDRALEAWRAGGANRFNPWGERCRTAAEQLEAAKEVPDVVSSS